MGEVTISQEKYEALIESKVKLDAITRYFENQKYGMDRSEFYSLTGFLIPEEEN